MNTKSAIDANTYRRRLRTPKTVPRWTMWVLLALVSTLLLSACGAPAPEATVGQVSRAGTPAPPATARVGPAQAPTETAPADTPTSAPTATDTPKPPTPTSPPKATDTPELPTPALTPTEAEASPSPETPGGEEPEEAEGRPYELPFLGPPDAAVTIVEFGDYY